MKKLYILGKAPIKQTIEELKKDDVEIWMCGTDKRKGADLYFELHNIIVNHENVIYCLPDEVYSSGLPINNSISAMLVFAWLKGYTDIEIIGAPMIARDEYIAQRSGLAYCVGYFNGKGLKVNWHHLPKNSNYGHN